MNNKTSNNKMLCGVYWETLMNFMVEKNLNEFLKVRKMIGIMKSVKYQ